MVPAEQVECASLSTGLASETNLGYPARKMGCRSAPGCCSGCRVLSTLLHPAGMLKP